MQGLGANLTVDRAQSMSFDLRMAVPSYNPLVYQLTLAPTGVTYEIAEEMLWQQRESVPPPFKHLQSRHGDIRYFEVPDGGLVPPHLGSQPIGDVGPGSQAVPRARGVSQAVGVLDSLPRFERCSAVAGAYAATATARSVPGEDGEDLVSCLFYLRESDRDRFEAIEDTLRGGFDDFVRLDFPPVAAGTLGDDLARPELHAAAVHAPVVREGMLRFLWLVTLLQSPGLTAVTQIDEPEVSLHPELLAYWPI